MNNISICQYLKQACCLPVFFAKTR